MLEKELETFLRDQLAKRKFCPDSEAEKLFDEKKKTGKRFVELLTVLDSAVRPEFVKRMSEFYRVPFLDLDQIKEVDPKTIKLIPEKLIRYFKIFPAVKRQDSLTVAMVDPLDVVLVDRLGQYAKCDIVPAFAAEEAIQRAIERFLGSLDTLGQTLQKAESAQRAETTVIGSEVKAAPADSTASVVHIVNLIIEKAIESRASDIHLEPADKSFYVRYRIDGVLYDYPSPPPKGMEAAIISRLKIMANLDIAEKRLPQDGRIQFHLKEREINLRISTFPTIHGENVVVRVLDRSDSVLALEEVGFESDVLKQFKRLVQLPHGIILVTGPTGSGKTTTLYGALREINTIERHVITLEDPVEYRMDRVRQSQIDPKSGLTFAKGLRSILRQDPDVIMIGEIRDLETATIAIQAALTGHLVLSTLHTNDAPSAVTRLLDMGVEPFLISSSLSCVLAQRLIRLLCVHCRKSYTPDKAVLEEIGISPAVRGGGKPQFYQSAGCEKCKQTGYQGRSGIFEFMIPDDDIRSLIVKKESSEVIRKAAVSKGMKTLKEEGLQKAFQGLTSLDEVLRVSQEF